MKKTILNIIIFPFVFAIVLVLIPVIFVSNIIDLYQRIWTKVKKRDENEL